VRETPLDLSHFVRHLPSNSAPAVWRRTWRVRAQLLEAIIGKRDSVDAIGSPAEGTPPFSVALAKLCRAGGGELEQIQLLLGHASVRTTECYLGTKQDLVHAPNDAIKLRVAV
jgi:hypothetical protein